MKDAADARRNRVLAALPDKVYQQTVDLLEPVRLELRTTLFESDQPIEYVYFPVDAVASLVITMASGATVECATVGNEGIVGLPVFLGVHSLPMTCFAQVSGAALRMTSDAFRQLLADVDGPFAVILQRYTQTMFSQLAQNVACNQLHSIEQRCARWLLMTADRVDNERFSLTQEFMATMLGVRRASVTEVAGRLAAAGSIAYHHGVIEVRDRPQLLKVSCECYQVITDMQDRMLGDPTHAADSEGAHGVPTPR